MSIELSDRSFHEPYGVNEPAPMSFVPPWRARLLWLSLPVAAALSVELWAVVSRLLEPGQVFDPALEHRPVAIAVVAPDLVRGKA